MKIQSRTLSSLHGKLRKSSVQLHIFSGSNSHLLTSSFPIGIFVKRTAVLSSVPQSVGSQQNTRLTLSLVYYSLRMVYKEGVDLTLIVVTLARAQALSSDGCGDADDDGDDDVVVLGAYVCGSGDAIAVRMIVVCECCQWRWS